MVNNKLNRLDSDYLDDFVHGYVVRQKLADSRRDAAEHRLVKEYLAAHPEQRPAARVARALRWLADRLAPEQARPIKQLSIGA